MIDNFSKKVRNNFNYIIKKKVYFSKAQNCFLSFFNLCLSSGFIDQYHALLIKSKIIID